MIIWPARLRLRERGAAAPPNFKSRSHRDRAGVDPRLSVGGRNNALPCDWLGTGRVSVMGLWRQRASVGGDGLVTAHDATIDARERSRRSRRSDQIQGRVGHHLEEPIMLIFSHAPPLQIRPFLAIRAARRQNSTGMGRRHLIRFRRGPRVKRRSLQPGG